MKTVIKNKTFLNLIQDFIRLPLAFTNGGFTLLEILVVVLIIGILGAIMLPQYQRAVLKSRYASLMPIAKAMADSNEAYFLEHGVYADNAQDLPVQGRQNYPDGTEIEFGTDTDYSYVLATRGNDFPNNYIVYQKHSGQFAGEIHCEADANDTQAQDVCKSFGPTEDIGETLTNGYLTYVLFGTGNGHAPISCPNGATCDDNGNITECPSGQTLNSGSCEECATAFPNATDCSATFYAATSCSTGYVLNGTVCEEDPNYAKLQAVVNEQCSQSQPQYVCTIDSKNGYVSKCNTDNATLLEDGRCACRSLYCEWRYDLDGREIYSSFRGGKGYRMHYTYYYDQNGRGHVTYDCKSYEQAGICASSKPVAASYQDSSMSKARYLACFKGTEESNEVNADGSCPSGYTWSQAKSDNAGFSSIQPCTRNYDNFDWETASCR